MHKIDRGELSGQAAYTTLLGLYAATQVGEASRTETARQKEISALGPTVTSRIDAIERFWDAKIGQGDGKSVTSRLWTAADVQREERRIAKMMGGGDSSFTGSGREPPPAAGRKSQAEIDAMQVPERLAYARQFPQPKPGRAA